MKSANRSLSLKLLVFVAGSFGFGFALVPLYGAFCSLVGIGNAKSLLAASAASPLGPVKRLVTVEFMTTLPTVGNWEFRPMTESIQVHPGQLNEVYFYAHNLTGHDVVAQAVPAISPSKATAWFHKTECFCFSAQSFKKDEQRVMPVRFFIDRDFPDYLDRVTLNYTFYDEPQSVAAR